MMCLMLHCLALYNVEGDINKNNFARQMALLKPRWCSIIGIFMNSAQGRSMLLTILLACTFQLAENFVLGKLYICLTIFHAWKFITLSPLSSSFTKCICVIEYFLLFCLHLVPIFFTINLFLTLVQFYSSVQKVLNYHFQKNNALVL